MTEFEMTLSALNQAFNHKYNSLAGYILTAAPYVKPGQAGLVECIRSIAEEDLQDSEAVARLIEQLGGIPQTQSPSFDRSRLNYLALDYVVTVLREDLLVQKKDYQQLENLLPGNLPEVKDLVHHLLVGLEQHLQVLQSKS